MKIKLLTFLFLCLTCISVVPSSAAAEQCDWIGEYRFFETNPASDFGYLVRKDCSFQWISPSCKAELSQNDRFHVDFAVMSSYSDFVQTYWSWNDNGHGQISNFDWLSCRQVMDIAARMNNGNGGNQPAKIVRFDHPSNGKTHFFFSYKNKKQWIGQIATRRLTRASDGDESCAAQLGYRHDGSPARSWSELEQRAGKTDITGNQMFDCEGIYNLLD